MENDKKRKSEPVYSLRLRAGKRRTYFFDVRPTRSNDFYLTITESKRRFDDNGYERHKLFIYKEDFNKFMNAMEITMDHVKEQLLPDYDFDEFTREIKDENIQEHPEAIPDELDVPANKNLDTDGDNPEEEKEEEQSASEEKTEEKSDDTDFEVKFDAGEEEASSDEEADEDEDDDDDTKKEEGDEPSGSDDEEAEKW